MGSRDQRSAKQLVDANSGVLSLLNDGSVNWPRSLRLAKCSRDDGVTRAIVTGVAEDADLLRHRLPQLSALLQQNGVALDVTLAVELTLQRDLFERAVEVSTTLGGLHRRYILLRVASDVTLPVSPVVEALARMQLTPVLLAPERYGRFRHDEVELKKVVSSGGLVQLSAASLTDHTDRDRAAFCRHLIRKGLCHFVASESGRHHDLPISLNEAYRVIASCTGHEVATTICCDNPRRLFDGECIAAPTSRRGLLKIFARAA